jgi:hypothetical protein
MAPMGTLCNIRVEIEFAVAVACQRIKFPRRAPLMHPLSDSGDLANDIVDLHSKVTPTCEG